MGQGPTVAPALQDALPHPVQAQERLLLQLLETNADTEFGRRHGFGSIASFREFQARVPIGPAEALYL